MLILSYYLVDVIYKGQLSQLLEVKVFTIGYIGGFELA